MKTLEYRTVDRSKWRSQRGPWENEPDKRQWLDPATGLPCLIVRGPVGALCGYVGVPRSHPAYEKDYDDVDVDVHGGLTFASKCSHGSEERGVCHKVDDGDDDDVWWLGFDCAHYGDLRPSYEIPGGDREYRSIEYVTREVEGLALQLRDYAPSEAD